MIFSALLLALITSGWWPIHPLPGLRATFVCDFTYDSNPFRYSPWELQEFEKGLKPHKYPIETRDDLIVKTGLSISYEAENLKLKLKILNSGFMRNREKSSLNFKFLAKRDPVYLELKFLPKFLIRYYPDWDSGGSYLPCYYSEKGGEFGLLPLKTPVRLTVYGFYFARKYPDYFTEYDTKLYGFGIRLRKKLRNWSPKFFYSFEVANAKGYDEPGEARETSDDSDISYKRHSVTFGVERNWSLFDFSTTYTFRRKCFTGNDLWHRDRVDTDHRLDIIAGKSLSRRLEVRIGYRLEKRNTSSPYSSTIEEIKNYTRHRISIGFVFTS